MSDEQIFNADVCETCGWKKDCKRCMALKVVTNVVGGDGAESNCIADLDDDEEDCDQNEVGDLNEEDDDDEDDFECDIERYVPFEDKLEFAERLKSCS